jgi:hypothetical protein
MCRCGSHAKWQDCLDEVHPMTDRTEKTGTERTYWLDNPQNVTKLYRTVWVIGIILVGFDLVVHKHEEFGFAGWFAFFAVYGFVACVTLVVAAKVLRRVVMRPEDYYER